MAIPAFFCKANQEAGTGTESMLPLYSEKADWVEKVNK